MLIINIGGTGCYGERADAGRSTLPPPVSGMVPSFSASCCRPQHTMSPNSPPWFSVPDMLRRCAIPSASVVPSASAVALLAVRLTAGRLHGADRNSWSPSRVRAGSSPSSRRIPTLLPHPWIRRSSVGAESRADESGDPAGASGGSTLGRRPNMKTINTRRIAPAPSP